MNKFFLRLFLISFLTAFSLPLASHDSQQSPATSFSIEQFLANPEAARKKAESVKSAFEKETSFEKLLAKNNLVENDFILFLETIKKFEKECSFFLLGECTQSGFGSCLLSRKRFPHHRQQFENIVVQAAAEKLSSLIDRPLYYTSFGSGGLFQDLVIVAKILQQKNDAHIVINLIDKQMKAYTDACKFLQISSQVTLNPLDLEANKEKVLASLRRATKSFQIEDLLNAFKVYVLNWQLPLQQLLLFLTTHFPHAKLRIVAYATIEDYLYDTTAAQQPYSDIIVAADIQDEMSLLQSSLQDYSTLCQDSLARNPSSSNFLLTTGLKSALAGTIVQIDAAGTFFIVDPTTHSRKSLV